MSDITGRPAAEILSALATAAMPIRPFTDFGPIRSGAADHTTTIQAALDASAGANFRVGQAGDFNINGLVIRDGVKLACPGEKVTNFLVRAASAESEVFALDTDVVQNVYLGGFSVHGQVAGQHGFRLRAIPASGSGILQGGLWYFVFQNIEMRDVSGDNIWLDGYGNAGGDPGAFKGPIQFGQFLNVRAFCGAAAKRALRLSGMVGQVGFDGSCQFDNDSGSGAFPGTAENIKLERAVNLDESLNSDMAPYSIKFEGITCQGNKRGATIERATSVIFHGGHFENLYEGILNSVSAFGNVVDGVEFANVGHRGDGTGFGCRNDGGLLTVRENKFSASSSLVACETHYVSLFDHELFIEGRHYDDTGIRTVGCTHSAIPSAATLDIDTGHDHYFVNGPQATPIVTLNAPQQPPGKIMSIRANGGFIALGTGGNINLGPYRTPLRLTADSIALLQYNDLTAQWGVIGLSQRAGFRWPDPVFVNHAASPYQAVAGTGSIRVDASAGDVVIKLPPKADTSQGERMSVKRLDSSANHIFINGATTAENPDGQADNVVKLVEITQSLTFERNGLAGSGGWDTIGSSSAKSGAPGSGATLTFGTHLQSGGASYDGSAPITITSDATPANTPSTIMARDTNGDFGGRVATLFGMNIVTAQTSAIDIISTTANQSTAISFYDVTSTQRGWVIYAGANGVGSKYFGVFNGAADYLALGTINGTPVLFFVGGVAKVEVNTDGSLSSYDSGSGGAALWRLMSTAVSPWTSRLVFSTDNTGWAFGISKNAFGTITQLVSFYDTGAIEASGNIYPTSDGINSVGLTGRRWSTINAMSATFSSAVNLNGGAVLPQNVALYLTDSGATNRRVAMASGTNFYYGDFDNSGSNNLILAAGGSGAMYFYVNGVQRGVMSATSIGLVVSIGITLATGATALDITDTSGNTGLSFTPANSSSSAFFDNRRVGSQTQFRCSNASANDVVYMTVFATGGVSFAKSLSVQGSLAMNAAINAYGLIVTDTAGVTGIALKPASGNDCFIDCTRVGSTVNFRVTQTTSGDRTWLSVTAAGAATFGFTVNLSSALNVTGATVFSSTVSFTTIATNVLPSIGNLDIGGGTSKWRDYYSTGKLEIGTTLQTGNPTGGGGAATWKFGSLIGGSFTLDTTHAVEVEVGGTYKRVAVYT